MLFQHVSIAGLAHLDAPHTLSSEEINRRLKPTLDRLGIKTDVLREVAGINARRLWDDGKPTADAATVRRADDQWARPRAVGTIAHPRGFIDDLIEGGRDEIGELNFAHRAQAIQRRADAYRDDGGFGERGIYHA